MKIAFYLENKNIESVDFSTPEKGNPGCGGTEYLFVALPYYLAQHQKQICTPVLFANIANQLPEALEVVQADDVYVAARKAHEIGCDVFVYRPKRHQEMDILDLVQKLDLPTIGWAHITPKSCYIRKMAQTPAFKALVCVEHEQYDLIQDSPLKNKLTFIVNGFDVDSFRLFDLPEKNLKSVVYLGALIPRKGFHLLAHAWPDVLANVPDAHLTVIGTGSLYDEKSVLGPLGVADQSYEEEHIIPYLTDNDNVPLPSVYFAGKLGHEKKEILHRALIGVPNPTGLTENCPGSSLEFSACGTAIVSGAYFGIMDTVQDRVTGLLGRNKEDLVRNICFLLDNPKQALSMGREGEAFVRDRYNWNKVTQQWVAFLKQVIMDQKIERKPFKSNIYRHHKSLIIINRLLQLTFGRLFIWPFIYEIKEKLYPKLAAIRNK